MFNRTSWNNFIVETILNDTNDRNVSKKDLCLIEDNTEALLNALEKTAESNSVTGTRLWLDDVPTGTEDRTWVRTFFCLIGVKFYSNMFCSLDRCSAITMASCFMKAGCDIPLPQQKIQK